MESNLIDDLRDESLFFFLWTQDLVRFVRSNVLSTLQLFKSKEESMRLSFDAKEEVHRTHSNERYQRLYGNVMVVLQHKATGNVEKDEINSRRIITLVSIGFLCDVVTEFLCSSSLSLSFRLERQGKHE
jgi:hypothetical protein